MPEPVDLATAKTYLRVRHSEEDAKITAMIPRARLWVEDHTGLALDQREFVERALPEVSGAIRLSKGPLIGEPTIAYVDQLGASQTYTPASYAPDTRIFHAADDNWPALQPHGAFEITYTAGFAPGEVDARLVGAMLALIEGEYAEGYAYPDRATDAAARCCAYLQRMAA